MMPFLAVTSAAMTKMKSLLMESTNGFAPGPDCGTKCIEWIPSGEAFNNPRKYSTWIRLKRNVEGSFLHPIGVNLYVDMSVS